MASNRYISLWSFLSFLSHPLRRMLWNNWQICSLLILFHFSFIEINDKNKKWEFETQEHPSWRNTRKENFFFPHPIRSLFLRYKFFFLYVSLIHLFIRLKLFLKCFKLFSWQVVFCCLFFLFFVVVVALYPNTHTRAQSVMGGIS